MARNRKRYYIARQNGPLNTWDVIRCRFTPAPEVFSYSHAEIIGPFRTSTAAYYDARMGGVLSVAEAESAVVSARPIAA